MRMGWVIPAMVAVVAATALGAPSAAVYTRTNSGGGVDIKATYAPPEYFVLTKDAAGAGKYKPDAQIVFLFAFDTHAGDLMQFDVIGNIRLRTSSGASVAPTGWEATEDGSHHRSGTLFFPLSAAGVRVIGPAVTSIELVISDLGGVPRRSLLWILPIR